MKKLCVVILLLFLIKNELYAQRFKGIKERISDSIEKRVLKNNSDNYSIEADTVWNEAKLKRLYGLENLPFNVGLDPFDISELPDAYYFTHLYRVKIKVVSQEQEVDYYLTNLHNYLGNMISSPENLKIKTVNDFERRLMVYYKDDKPMVFKMPTLNILGDEKDDQDYIITYLSNKKYLGFDCIGRQMENDFHTIIFYIAPGLGVDMCDPFESKSNDSDPMIRLKDLGLSGGLIIYMEVIDKKNKGTKSTSSTMECILFEKRETIIKNR
jgi:hypothetical protein